MPSRIDLHTHTTASDGTLTPAELLQEAQKLSVKVLAISDHDSTAGYQAALSANSSLPSVRLIPAIEINAGGPLACHLLGYFVDIENKTFQDGLALYRRLRVSRLQTMTQKLNALGLSIDFQRVLEIAKGGTLGRPHLADALREKGYVRSRQEAFNKYLGKYGPAYIPTDIPSAKEAVDLIRGAGGVPVLAHPSYYTSDSLLKTLVDWGVRGLEAYYPDHSRALTRRFLDLAEHYHLAATGGSDFHGPRTGRAALACVEVPESVIDNLEKAR